MKPNEKELVLCWLRDIQALSTPKSMRKTAKAEFQQYLESINKIAIHGQDFINRFTNL